MQASIHDRHVLWQGWDTPGIEHLHVREHAGEVVADGAIVGRVDGQLLRMQYELYADGAYHFQSLRVQMTYPVTQTLFLARTYDGTWSGDPAIDGAALRDCADIDLSASPFTNTLPIRRLPLQIGQAETMTVAFIEIPSLQVRPERQRYQLLARAHDRRMYRFEHLANRYAVTITVDSDGLVIDYPELFRRV